MVCQFLYGAWTLAPAQKRQKLAGFVEPADNKGTFSLRPEERVLNFLLSVSRSALAR